MENMYTKYVHGKWLGYISILVIYYSPSVLVQMGLLWLRISSDSLQEMVHHKHERRKV